MADSDAAAEAQGVKLAQQIATAKVEGDGGEKKLSKNAKKKKKKRDKSKAAAAEKAAAGAGADGDGVEDVENADGVSEVGDDSDKAKLIQALMGSMGGLRVGEKQADDATHKFWDTQPVPKMGE